MSTEESNHANFIKLWTSACSAENYNKQTWIEAERQLIEAGVIKQLRRSRKFNPFFCKSEGKRRLTIAASAATWILWLIYIAEDSRFFSDKGMDNPLSVISALIAFPLFVYLIIIGIRGTVLWVVRGFRLGA